MPSEKDGKDKHIGNGVYKRTWLYTHLDSIISNHNIKPGSGIYKAVIDRPIRYKNSKLIINYTRIVPLVEYNV